MLNPPLKKSPTSPNPQAHRNRKLLSSPSIFSTKMIVRFWLIGALFVCLGYRFYQSLEVVYLIISALIIAISAEGMILAFQRKLKSRWVAIGMSYFVLMLFVFSGVFFVVPFLVSQISLLVSWVSKVVVGIKDFVVSNARPDAIYQLSFLPDLAKDYLVTHWEDFNWSNADFQASVLSVLNAILESSTSYLKQFSSSIFSVIGGFFGILANLAIVFTMAIFFSIEKDYLVSLLAKPFAKHRKSEVKAKIDDVYRKLSLWLKARVYLSLFIFLAIYLAFWVMKRLGFALPNMFSLALITGLLDIIPYVGPLFAMIPIVISAWIHHGIWGMLIVGGVYLLLQWVQNNVILPLLMEKQLGVNSVLVLLSALLGATVMGFWGIVLSVPLAVIVSLWIDEKED